MTKLCNAFSLQMLNLDEVNTVKIEPVKIENVNEILKEGFSSAIGHEDTANVLSNMLDTDIPCNRVSVSLEKGDTVIVAQFVGGRLPAGATKLPEDLKLKFVKVSIQS